MRESMFGTAVSTFPLFDVRLQNRRAELHRKTKEHKKGKTGSEDSNITNSFGEPSKFSDKQLC